MAELLDAHGSVEVSESNYHLGYGDEATYAVATIGSGLDLSKTRLAVTVALTVARASQGVVDGMLRRHIVTLTPWVCQRPPEIWGGW